MTNAYKVNGSPHGRGTTPFGSKPIFPYDSLHCDYGTLCARRPANLREEMSATVNRNPLLDLPFRVPFDQIRAEHVQPAMGELLREARQRIDALAADLAPRTFDNTLALLDSITEPLDQAMAVVRHLESVATYPEL